MKNRSRTEIIALILKAAMIGATRSKLMLLSYLSYPQAKSYIFSLLESNMLTYDEATQIYKTSEKGIKFLHSYHEMIGLFPDNLEKPILPSSNELWSHRIAS